MAIFIGQGSTRGVHTVFANKRMYAFDMCFKLIGLSTHVRVIKQNDCGPAAAFPRSRLVFNNINQVLVRTEKKTYLCNFGVRLHIPSDLALGRSAGFLL